MAYSKITIEEPVQAGYLVPFPIDSHLSVFLNGNLLNLGDDYILSTEAGELVFTDGLLDAGDTLEFRRL